MNLLNTIVVGSFVGTRLSRPSPSTIDNPSLEARETRALHIELAAQRGVRIPTFEEEAAQERAERRAQHEAFLAANPHVNTQAKVFAAVIVGIPVAIVVGAFIWHTIELFTTGF